MFNEEKLYRWGKVHIMGYMEYMSSGGMRWNGMIDLIGWEEDGMGQKSKHLLASNARYTILSGRGIQQRYIWGHPDRIRVCNEAHTRRRVRRIIRPSFSASHLISSSQGCPNLGSDHSQRWVALLKKCDLQTHYALHLKQHLLHLLLVRVSHQTNLWKAQRRTQRTDMPQRFLTTPLALPPTPCSISKKLSPIVLLSGRYHIEKRAVPLDRGPFTSRRRVRGGKGWNFPPWRIYPSAKKPYSFPDCLAQ